MPGRKKLFGAGAVAEGGIAIACRRHCLYANTVDWHAARHPQRRGQAGTRASTLRTAVAVQAPPRGVLMPRLVISAATWRSDRPRRRMSVAIGPTSAAKASAYATAP